MTAPLTARLTRLALTLLGALVILSAVPALAHAADPAAAAQGSNAYAEHQPIIPGIKQAAIPAITALITFFIVFAILYVKVWPMINKGLDDRATKIRDEIAAAELARKQAADALDEYEKNLSEARAESKAMLEKTKSEQAALAAQLRAKADAELSELRDRARQDIEAAKRAAVSEIYATSVALASQMASKILQREVSAADQQRLVDESLAELQSRA